MTKFEINKKYDAILILNSGLVLLSNDAEIKKTLQRCHSHLKEKGIMMLDLPNHSVEIKEQNFAQEHKHYTFGDATLDVIFRDYRRNNKWVSEWHGFECNNRKFSEFKEHYEERIYDPKSLEQDLKFIGFKILKVFGSRAGGKFNEKTSYRRFYLCQKENSNK